MPTLRFGKPQRALERRDQPRQGGLRRAHAALSSSGNDSKGLARQSERNAWLSWGSAVRHDLVGRIAEEDVAPVRAPLRDAQGKALGALVEGDPGYAQALAVLARPHVH